MTLAQPYGSPAVVTPHLAFPFTLTDSGAVVVEQDSIEDVFSCVQVVVNCQIGQCPELSSFGIPDPTFSQAPPDASLIIAAVQEWEPRANESSVVTALDSTGSGWQMALTTSTDATSTL